MKMVPGKLYRYCNYTHNHMRCNTILMFLGKGHYVSMPTAGTGQTFFFLKGKETIEIVMRTESILRGLENYFTEDLEGISACYP